MKHHFQMLKHVTMDLVAKQNLLQNTEDVSLSCQDFQTNATPFSHLPYNFNVTTIKIQTLFFFEQGSFGYYVHFNH